MKKSIIMVIVVVIVGLGSYWAYIKYLNYKVNKRTEVEVKVLKEVQKNDSINNVSVSNDPTNDVFTKIEKLSEVELKLRKKSVQAINFYILNYPELKLMPGKSGRANWHIKDEHVDVINKTGRENYFDSVNDDRSFQTNFLYCPFKNMIAFFERTTHKIYFKNYDDLPKTYVVNLSYKNEEVVIESIYCGPDSLLVLANYKSIYEITTTEFPPSYRGQTLKSIEKEIRSGIHRYDRPGFMMYEKEQNHSISKLRNDILLRIERRSEKVNKGLEDVYFTKVYLDKLKYDGTVIESRLVMKIEKIWPR